MLSNDIKKGMEVVANGFSGSTMMDNLKGNIRMVKVNGFVLEIGSVYVWDISEVKNPVTGLWEKVELTDKQKAAKKMVNAIF